MTFDMLDAFQSGGDLMGSVREIGQGDFGVRITQYDPIQRFFVARTLGGHPLAGWRRWQVEQQPGGDIVITTFSVEYPETMFDAVKMLAGGQAAMAQTWTNMLDNLADYSAGGIVVDSDTRLSGVDLSHSEAIALKPLVDGGIDK